MNESLKENIAAISATFHVHRKYNKFYEANRDALSGFVGIWNLCVEAAEAFTKAEKALKIEWDGDWIGAIDDFVEAIYLDGTSDMEKLAITSIKQTLAWEKMARDGGWTGWSRKPGKPPVQFTGYYVLWMEDDDALEDHHYCVCYTPDGSWTTMDRRDMNADAKRWNTARAAKQAFKKIGGGKKERITLVHVDAKQFINEIEVLHDTFTKKKR